MVDMTLTAAVADLETRGAEFAERIAGLVKPSGISAVLSDLPILVSALQDLPALVNDTLVVVKALGVKVDAIAPAPSGVPAVAAEDQPHAPTPIEPDAPIGGTHDAGHPISSGSGK